MTTLAHTSLSPVLRAKAERAIAVVANRDRLRRIREALARMEESLRRSVELKRTYDVVGAEHCHEVGLLHQLAVLQDDVDGLEIK